MFQHRAQIADRRFASKCVAQAAIVACTLLFPPYSSHAQNSAQRVLVLSSYNISYPGVLGVGQGIAERLKDRSPERVELLNEFLDLARFPEPDHAIRTAAYLAEKYSLRKPSVVITAGREASLFVLRFRNIIAPDVPIVVCCLPAEEFAALGVAPKITGVISGRDISKTLGLAQRLQPNARNLVIVAGATEFDRQWVKLAAQQIEGRELRYGTKYLVGVPYNSLLKEMSRLPRDTIVITLTYFADDQGGRYVSPEVIRAVANAASAPVYSPYATSFGFGLVGGHSDFNEAMGAQTADLALEILAGKDPDTIAPQLSNGGAYRVDARQIKRWQLSDANLPPGTVLEFKEATLWKEHRLLIASVLLALVLQSVIIGYVLMQNRKRRIAERSLAESEERMALSAASTSTGLWQFQAEDKPIWATEHCQVMLGLAENSPLSFNTFREAIHPDDRSVFAKTIREAASSGRPSAGEFRIMTPEDTTRWIAMRCHPRRDGNHGPYCVNGVFNDVTALKNAEHEADVQRLETSRLMRQSILGELSGTIAHELNQPLTAILSNAEAAQDLLSRKDVDLGKIQEIVADIIEEDSRAGEVISRIRKLLRKGEGKSEAIDLNQLVTSTLRLLHGELVKRVVQVELALATGLPPIWGDPVQLQQVLLNLIMNAMDAVRLKAPPQRSIGVSTRLVEKRLEIAVVDRGHGVAAADEGRLFQPFFTTKEHGLGLGLSICSTIVKSHGGRLSLENNVTGGATAIIALPTPSILAAAS